MKGGIMNIRKIGIAGSGTMGSSMAKIFARYGFDVVLYSHRQPSLDLAKERIGLPEAEKIIFTTDMSLLSDRELTVENLPEVMETKRAFYRELCGLVSEDAIIATNTSGLSINRLSEAVTRPERFLGMHWVNPPHLIPLVEIIKNDHTLDETASAVYETALAIGKKPVIVRKDVPGFLLNRIQLAVAREALSLVDQGVTSEEDIDSVLKYGLGIRWACMGPLETMDFGGLDIFYHIAEYLVPDLCDSHEIPQALKDHYQKGEYGVKSGSGFFDYPAEEVAARLRARDEKLEKLIRDQNS